MTPRGSLADALRAAGIECAVEARERLAVLTASPAGPLADPAVRARVLRLARAHGFTHVALECGTDGGAGANLRRP